MTRQACRAAGHRNRADVSAAERLAKTGPGARPGRLHARRAGQDRGSLTLFAAVAMAGLLMIAAFAVDVGGKMQAAQTARSIAEEAARAGAAVVNRSAAYSRGTYTVDPQAAITAAQEYLSQSGHTGSVMVAGNRTIEVTVTVTRPAVFTEIIGIRQLSATETATATLTQGVTVPQP
jgi:Flp pilus assembly protein TadG